MKIAVVGVGHVGLVTAACLAQWGHEVVGMDEDTQRIETLLSGAMPFYEPDLPELVAQHVRTRQLRFSPSMREALAGAELVFVCVGTPPLPGGGPNLSYVEQVGRDVARHATGDLVLVEKSTVPANTGVRMRQVLEREQRRLGSPHVIDVASNPEFLREGSAVPDTLHPDRIVYGTASERARDVLREVYRTVVEEDGCPVVETDVPTAELIKHASNAFLATKISFINAVSQICERVGADVHQVAEGMGLDQRIGSQFLRAGLGYGGSCFPKDVDAFIHLAGQVGYDFRLLEEVRRINVRQREAALDKLRHELWHLDQKVVTVLGAAFKPGTDDLREAPGMHIAEALLAEGATVRMWDPVAITAVKDQFPDVELFEDARTALRDAHAVVVATEWDELDHIAPQEYVELLAYPIVVDGRNIYDPESMLAAGVRYHSIGRRGVGRIVA